MGLPVTSTDCNVSKQSMGHTEGFKLDGVTQIAEEVDGENELAQA